MSFLKTTFFLFMMLFGFSCGVPKEKKVVKQEPLPLATLHESGLDLGKAADEQGNEYFVVICDPQVQSSNDQKIQSIQNFQSKISDPSYTSFTIFGEEMSPQEM